MKALIGMSPLNNFIRCVVVYFGFFLLASLLINGGQECRAADDFGYMIEDFKGDFVSVPGYGSTPFGWSASGPEEVVFSKGIGSHHGQSGLYAEATYDPTYYTVLETVLVGQPGDILYLQIQAKAATIGTAQARFAAEIDNTINSTTSFWYDNSSTDWRSMTLENVQVPPNGEIPISLSVAHTVRDGSTDFDFDCLTATAFLWIKNGNRPPVLDPIGEKTVNENQLLEFTITATDPDDDGLDYTASNLPTGANFNPVTQEFSWRPGTDDVGNYTVEFAVTDDGNPPLSDSETVTINVEPKITPVDEPIDNGSSSGGRGGGCFISCAF